MAFPSPDKSYILQFVASIFKNADPQGFVNLRAFLDNKDGPFAPQSWRSIQLSAGLDILVSAAYTLALAAAEARDSVVFCPPAATFIDGGGASEQNIHNGVVLIIECDKRPQWALETLASLIGPPTIVVASGGFWSDAKTNKTEEKLHAYWRLATPTKTQDEHDLLAEARRLAAVYVGADPTSGPICHPIRWPGSWHRKAEPRLTRIEHLNEDAEINLAEALGKLRAVLPAQQKAKEDDYEDNEEPADPDDIRSALAIIPNDERDWDYWNAVGMAIWCATRGADEGMALFDTWSAKSSKYDRTNVVGRWRHYWRSPPTKTGAAKLFAAAIKIDSHWHPKKSRTRKTNESFRLNAKGIIVAHDITNIKIGLDRLNMSLSYDSFAAQQKYVNGKNAGNLSDDIITTLWFKFEQELQFRPAMAYFESAIRNISIANSHDPVREHLAALPWDGQPRISTWLISLAGAPDNEYTRAVSSLILIAGIARVYDPGCKFDEMLVLESPKQGTEKSTALRVLTGYEEWFTDGLELGSRNKEVMEQISGKWIIEASDLSGMRRSDVESMKQFLSKQSDRARLAYGRLTTERKRSCIFFGTTNSSRYLRDEQNRRFWPVRIKQFNLAELEKQRGQLWAEARHMYENGASIRLAPSLYSLAEFEQSERRIEDPWVDDLRGFFSGLTGRVVTADVFSALGIINATQRGQNENQRIGEAMRELGWVRERVSFRGDPRWCYVKGNTEKERRIPLYVYRDITGIVSVSSDQSPSAADIEDIKDVNQELPL